MIGRKPGRLLVAAWIAAIALVASGLWLRGPGSEPAPSPSAAGPTPTASPSPDPEPPPTQVLALSLGRVLGHGPAGEAAAEDLAGAAEAVRAAIAELYTIGFVDPDRWEGGTFRSLFRLFSRETRPQAHDDLARLTLGAAANALDDVRPRPARLHVRFLVDAASRPVVAFAKTTFEAIGRAEDVRVPIRHEGEFVLRPVNGEWRVVGYDVRRRMPPRSEIERRVEQASFVPGLPSRDPLFVLVIGSDARPGQSVTRSRADSLHLVGVDPRRGIASILGIPRDSYVAIPGFGVRKINEALVRGGPELQVRTVELLTGVGIDGYLLTGFEGFEQMVRAVGGIRVNVPYDVDDRYSHARFRKGRTHLSGREALAFARNRHAARGGDFGRSLNQGRLMIAALEELQAGMRRGKVALVPWAIAAARYVRSDLGFPEMTELLLAAPTFDPAEVRNRVVSGSTATVGGRSVVLLGEGARAMFRDLAHDGVLDG